MPAPARPCPICGQPVEHKYRPFCSPRCRDIDLHRWFAGVYAVPAVEAEDSEEDGADGGASPARP